MDPLDKRIMFSRSRLFTIRKLAKECEILMQLSFATIRFNDSESRECFFVTVSKIRSKR